MIRFRDHTQTQQSRCESWDEWTTHSTDFYLTKRHSQEIDILDSGGIRTRNPSKREAADPLLRPRGRREVRRLFSEVVYCIMN